MAKDVYLTQRGIRTRNLRILTSAQDKTEGALKAFVSMGSIEDALRIAGYCVTVAQAYERLDHKDRAINLYYQLLSQVPDLKKHATFCDVQQGIARTKLKENDAERALEAAQKALDYNRGAAGAHKLVGDIQLVLGQLEKARVTMNRAIFYEAPWDVDNYSANLKCLHDIDELIDEKERQRVLEMDFVAVFGEALEAVQNSGSGPKSWSDIKLREYDMFDDDEEGRAEADEIRETLESAASKALAADGFTIEEDEFLSNDELIENTAGEKVVLEKAPIRFRLRYTKDSRHWYLTCDPKYRDFFVRRLYQLQAGDRSRILSKRLTGSKNVTIYETYLEQKSGFRILWTEERNVIITWYVSSHDRVSYYMRRIDEAYARGSRSRQLYAFDAETDTFTEVDYEQDIGDDDYDEQRILLDPLGDTPLKLYAINAGDLERMKHSNWIPKMLLTTQERKIVEKPGTVLLLGRSGTGTYDSSWLLDELTLYSNLVVFELTGKTVCISNRIDRDRHAAEGDSTFSQLFVARSHRICVYVEETVGEAEEGVPTPTYLTFQKLLVYCEDELFGEKQYDLAKKMDYRKFKHVFNQSDFGGLDHLIVWTQIRTFIKGSIETMKKSADAMATQLLPLTKEEYLNFNVFGKNRCRLSEEHRALAYG